MGNGALGRSHEYSMYSLGRILKAPFGKPLATSLTRPLAKSPRVFGLWSWLGCGLGFAFKKSRIRETKHLSTDADSSTDTIVGWTKKTPKADFF